MNKVSKLFVSICCVLILLVVFLGTYIIQLKSDIVTLQKTLNLKEDMLTNMSEERTSDSSIKFVSTTFEISIETPEWAKSEYIIDNSISYIDPQEYIEKCQNNELFLQYTSTTPDLNYASVTFGDVKIKAPYRPVEYGNNIYPKPSKNIIEKTKQGPYELAYEYPATPVDAISFGELLFSDNSILPNLDKLECLDTPRHSIQMLKFEKDDELTELTIFSKFSQANQGKLYEESINGLDVQIFLRYGNTGGIFRETNIAFKHKGHIYVLRSNENSKPKMETLTREVISQIELL